MQKLAALTLALALGACAEGGAPANAPVQASVPVQDRRARIVLECRLLERASAEAVARGLAAPADILVGCPGHEHLRDTMTLSQMSAATRLANAAQVPAGVRAIGPRADMVFRRMITRGVPPAVADTMTATPEFAAAVR